MSFWVSLYWITILSPTIFFYFFTSSIHIVLRRYPPWSSLSIFRSTVLTQQRKKTKFCTLTISTLMLLVDFFEVLPSTRRNKNFNNQKERFLNLFLIFVQTKNNVLKDKEKTKCKSNWNGLKSYISISGWEDTRWNDHNGLTNQNFLSNEAFSQLKYQPQQKATLKDMSNIYIQEPPTFGKVTRQFSLTLSLVPWSQCER